MRHGMVRIIGCLFLASASLLSMSVSAADKITIGWVYAMANAPAIIAQQHNMFEKHGVKVELRQFNSGPLAMRALEAGDLDMAYIGMPPVYHAYDDGLHLKIVAKVNYGHAALITRQDSDIKTLADLKNKRIASVRQGSGMDILLRSFVLKESAGLDPTDVTIVSMPAKIMQASVQRGLVDAAFTWEPYVSQAVIADNARVLFDVNEKLPQYPWYVLVATEAMTHSKRDAMLRVLKAHKQAVNFLNESPDAGAKMLVEKFHLDNVITAAGSRKEATDIVHQARTRLGWECNFRQADVMFLQRLINYSKELGYLKQSIKAEDLLDQAAIDSLIKE